MLDEGKLASQSVSVAEINETENIANLQFHTGFTNEDLFIADDAM